MSRGDPIDLAPPVEKAFLVAVDTGDDDGLDRRRQPDRARRPGDHGGRRRRGRRVAEPPPRRPQLVRGQGQGRGAGARPSRETGFDILVADDELSPAQQKSLESLLNVKVIDRSRLILDIFALHAQTHEGRLQVELAQLEYQLPRLTRLWTHLSRTQGGIGSRGPGESQLETDRRIIRERIKKMKARVEDVRRQRETTARGRDRRLYPTVAIVGYTNAGKSTLLNALVGSEVAKAEDKLFATLDPTSRQVKLGDGQTAIVTDTVGFIHKLPHQLVDAFRATLEEVTRADVLVEVVDASDGHNAEHRATVQTVLDELGAGDKPRLAAFNKADLLYPGADGVEAGAGGGGQVLVSAATGFGLDTLRAEIAALLASLWEDIDVAVPYAAGELLARVRERGTVDARVRRSGRPGAPGGWRPGWPASCAPRRERWEASLAAEGVGVLSDRTATPGSVRRAGSGRTATGDRVWWSVAEGRRGRRWREAIVGEGGLRHSLLLETAAGRRVQPPRAVHAGRAADAAPRGRRHAPRQRHRGGRDPARRRAALGRGRRGRHRGVGDRRSARCALSARRQIAPGASARRTLLRVTAGLLITTGPALVERIDGETWRIAGGQPFRTDADGVAAAGRCARRGRSSNRSPRPIRGKPRHRGPFVDALWTRSCARLPNSKLVDNAVVAPAACPVWFVLPEGAAELKTEPTVLASTETGSDGSSFGRFAVRGLVVAGRPWGGQAINAVERVPGEAIIPPAGTTASSSLQIGSAMRTDRGNPVDNPRGTGLATCKVVDKPTSQGRPPARIVGLARRGHEHLVIRLVLAWAGATK